MERPFLGNTPTPKENWAIDHIMYSQWIAFHVYLWQGNMNKGVYRNTTTPRVRTLYQSLFPPALMLESPRSLLPLGDFVLVLSGHRMQGIVSLHAYGNLTLVFLSVVAVP